MKHVNYGFQIHDSKRDPYSGWRGSFCKALGSVDDRFLGGNAFCAGLG